MGYHLQKLRFISEGDLAYRSSGGNSHVFWPFNRYSRVGVPRGTTQDLNFSEVAPKGCTIIRYEDDATAVSALLSGQVDMIGTTQIVASKIEEKHPGKVQLKFILRESPGHFGVRRGEFDLLNHLNTLILYHRMNGDFDKISMKWLGVPVGPLPSM